jgi:formamidopyrimidine-DNA glycosylase
MPELPDVEGFRRALATKLTGHRIERVQVRDAGVLRDRTPTQVNEQLAGRRFREPDRHGKWLLPPTDGPCVLVHCGMTGRPYLANPDDEPDRYDRLIITTDNAQLRYADLRKLRGIWLGDDDAETSEILGAHGPDALQISTADFIEALRGRRGQLKAALLDQTFVAGLGNMLSDEICWRAHLHPAAPIPTLSGNDLSRVAAQMRTVLRAAVRAGHIPRTRTWLNWRRAAPDLARCPRCATALRRIPIGGRTSLWCPHCQPER